MGRTCTVCQHKQRTMIEKKFTQGVPANRIAEDFGVSTQALDRHVKQHLPPALAKAAEKRDITTAGGILDELQSYIVYVKKLLAACDEYLKDPENPKKYNLGPRAEDIEVIYYEEDDKGRMRKEKALLSELIREVPNVFAVRYNCADPRELILKTSLTLNRQLELIARIQGHIKGEMGEGGTGPAINITINAVWQEFRSMILRATAKYPEARAALVKELERARAD